MQSDNATEPYAHRAVACLVRRVQRAQGEALPNLRSRWRVRDREQKGRIHRPKICNLTQQFDYNSL